MSSNASALEVLECFPAFVIVVHVDTHEIVYCNGAAQRIFNKDGTGKLCNEFFNSDSLIQKYRHQVSVSEVCVFDELIEGKWYHILNSPSIWIDQKPVRILTGFDVTVLKGDGEHAPLSDYLDSLTGASNRQTGLHYFNLYLQEVKNSDFTFTVCYIDLNDLKYINDNFGHTKGDEYLQTVASCIRSSTRRTDMLARMGGDEFLLLFPNCRYEIVDKIMTIVTNKLNFAGESESRHYSIAYGIMEVNAETPLDMEYILNTVDSKMYCMKNEYKQCRGSLPQLQRQFPTQ